jgi:hypothetical protein
VFLVLRLGRQRSCVISELNFGTRRVRSVVEGRFGVAGRRRNVDGVGRAVGRRLPQQSEIVQSVEDFSGTPCSS